MGGGWCVSIEDCYARSLTNLGSTTTYPQTFDLSQAGPYFDDNQTVNPLMFNWNLVFLIYCDGTSFSSNNDTQVTFNHTLLHFRGKRILQAMATDLLKNALLSSASNVVISGCSAGGLATYLHIDWWVDQLPQNAKVVGLPDSGFFVDLDSQPVNYHTSMVWVFENGNCSSGVNDLCIANNQASPYNCIFAEHVSPWIQTPLFPFQPKYDYWQIYNVLGSENVTLVNKFGDYELQVIQSTLLKSRIDHGIWLDSCTHHCFYCEGWKPCPPIEIKNVTPLQAFTEWFTTGKQHDYYIDNQPYDCETCC